MSLLTYKTPVDYEAQEGKITSYPTRKSICSRSVAAFEDFLKTFKSSETSATNALKGLQLDDDNTSDEYDFMDDLADEARQRTRSKRMHDASSKYMVLLQEIADRFASQVTIELDDLKAVRLIMNRLGFQQLY